MLFPVLGLPARAMQYYRQVRSYLAAEDYQSAIENLNSALEIAQSHGQNFPEAEALLEMINNLLIADKSRENVKDAMKDERWEDALSHMNDVLRHEDDHNLEKAREALSLYLFQFNL